MPERLLEINDLHVRFSGTPAAAVAGISLHIAVGETLGVVGESGSGKSLTALALAGLLPQQADVRWSKFSIVGQNTPLAKGARPGVAMIFQDPLNALNPVFRCGYQVAEAVAQRHAVSRAECLRRATDLLASVGLPEPEQIARAYPHELSGGQQQRVMIAMALALEPRLLIADEPTTALDSATQQGILDLLADLKATRNLSLLLISHDLGVVGALADRIAVMQNGHIVETGPTESVLLSPNHPYTRGLLACRPPADRRYERLPTLQDYAQTIDFKPIETIKETILAHNIALYSQAPLLRADNIRVQYPKPRRWLFSTAEWFDAVQPISFEVFPGETLGLIGQSGSGKTSLGKALLCVPLEGSEAKNIPDTVLIPQNPFASLNPRQRVGECLEEPLLVYRLVQNRTAARERALELLAQVDLDASLYERYPDELSGGQRQRICIARALTISPKVLICDEITSALDVSVQATVLNLLRDLQERFGLTYILISHDMRVARHMCDRVLMLREGRAIALGIAEEVLDGVSLYD